MTRLTIPRLGFWTRAALFAAGVAVATSIGLLACSGGGDADSSDENATACNAAGVAASPIFQNVALEDVPTALVFSPKNDQVFVTQQLGVIKTFDNSDSARASVFIDLRQEVNNGGQREPGINGLVVHPN